MPPLISDASQTLNPRGLKKAEQVKKFVKAYVHSTSNVTLHPIVCFYQNAMNT
jgi:hypothetical protein